MLVHLKCVNLELPASHSPPIRYSCAVGTLRPIRGRSNCADSKIQWKLSKYLTKAPAYQLLDWFQTNHDSPEMEDKIQLCCTNMSHVT